MEEKAFPKRKPTRLSTFDYSRGGAYFITICTQDRKRILSHIVRTNGIESVGEGFALPLIGRELLLVSNLSF